MASVISSAGVDVILVGDSLGMVIQGHEVLFRNNGPINLSLRMCG
ncbi:MAG: hypothetical protein CM15mP108_0260 [Gammaproteobacteria bacterium]|nr:MAG: hypothetical protein CM15mP108_0260 [Gammaproteobacteria bacterium]